MKKILTALLVLFCSCAVFQSCTYSKASKPAKMPPTISGKIDADALSRIGFSNSISIQVLKTSQNKEKYAKMGFSYLSQEEIDNIATENNFVVGPASVYVGEIPEQAATQIVENFTRVSSTLHLKPERYVFSDGTELTRAQIDARSPGERNWLLTNGTLVGHGNMTTYVIGPLTKFNTNDMNLRGRNLEPKSKDPIVVVSIDEGYIELARW